VKLASHQRCAIAALAAVITVGFAGCGSSSGSTSERGGSSAAPVTMSVAIDPWIGYAPWYIAQSKGYDVKNGVKLDFVDFVEDKDLEAAVASGQLDSTHGLMSTALRFEGANIPIKVALFQDASTTAGALIASHGISTIQGLKGKNVAIEEGGIGDILFRLALKDAGMSASDVHILNIPSAQAGAALIAGRVDAAYTYEPYLSAARSKGDFTTVIEDGAYPGVSSDVWEISDSFAKDHPAAVTGALRAWSEAVDYIRANPDQALALIADKYQTDVASLKASLAGIKLYNTSESLTFMNTQFVPLASRVKAILDEQGTLTGNPDPSALLDTTFAQQAAAG
jgi:NitT/TauT family transport system substrate-binding protein